MIPTFTPLRLSRTGLTGTTAIPVCRNRRRVYGAIIIDAREPEPFTYDREHVVMLSDWTDENPHSLLKKLKNSQITTISINQPLALFRDVNTRGCQPPLPIGKCGLK